MTTIPDRLSHMGGVPVGSGGPYGSFWGNDVFFVDYDNGTAGAKGKAPDDACKYLQDAIDLAGEWDTIYIRPRDPNITGGDSNYHLPESTTNWSIANTKEGLSLIGTGLGMNGHGMAYQTYLRGQATSPTTGAVLAIAAPFVSIENLAFHRGAVTGGNHVAFTPGLTSFAGSVNNCLFRFNDGTDHASAALLIKDAWYTMVYNSVFYRNVVGIGLYPLTSSVRCVTIKGNNFQGLAAAVNCHIQAPGTCSYVTIAENYFIDAKPTKGGEQKYISFMAGTACTGLLVHNYFNTTVTTIATNVTVNGLGSVENYVAGGSALA